MDLGVGTRWVKVRNGLELRSILLQICHHDTSHSAVFVTVFVSSSLRYVAIRSGHS
jgi:hypothetical protein